MIPIENSLHGRVADIHFLLPESGLWIIGEHFQPISHALLGKGLLADVRHVLSHPQALGQCRQWLRSRNLAPLPFADTAAAAAHVSEIDDHSLAAIAPVGAAEIYGLRVLDAGIGDSDKNVTRFLVLARTPAAVLPRSANVVTTVIFAVRNESAALYKALGGFATNHVNMTKLESYQKEESFSATEFYADFIGHPDAPHIARALDELRFHTRWVRVLGVYPSSQYRLDSLS